ncbi:MAG: hypothetical protein K9M49_00690 [Candidatus Marinimicrobia bacterium]|nr:hypothetical protein [Candidatus Neomarinimicrobiota bacterium]MCF7850621.1 hypothetical protein [Candidatus Neomarinimicrobiota bacterium]MCF7903645.1 hypothetical protein [Candidatus Neomarinimicrobiota bacterium]
MEQTSFLQRIVDLVFTPSKAFNFLSDGISYKDWLYPMIIVSLGIIILPLFFRDVSYDEAEKKIKLTEERIMSNPDIPEDRLATFEERMADAKEKIRDSKENPLALRNLWGYLLVPAMLFLQAAFFTLVLLMVGNFGMGEKIKFFQLFTVVMSTYIIGGSGFFMNMMPGVGTIEMLVKTPLIVMRESTDMLFSPGLIFDNIDSYFKQFLNQLDLFRIWGVAVMGFGFAKLYNKSTATGIVAVSIPWLILVAIGAALINANNMLAA